MSVMLFETEVNVGFTVKLPDGTLIRAIDVEGDGIGWIQWEPFKKMSHWSEWYVIGSRPIEKGTGPKLHGFLPSEICPQWIR
jgi:hypothetical protein